MTDKLQKHEEKIGNYKKRMMGLEAAAEVEAKSEYEEPPHEPNMSSRRRRRARNTREIWSSARVTSSWIRITTFHQSEDKLTEGLAIRDRARSKSSMALGFTSYKTDRYAKWKERIKIEDSLEKERNSGEGVTVTA